MFYEDDYIITTVDLAYLKAREPAMEDCETDELALNAYLNDLELSPFLAASIKNDYEEIFLYVTG